ncbi:GNAT family N-acetyltransferase [Mariniflexile sp.]|uniref:GNAT family N-acetyltransferase n=1 Tax=Mariniflexile sp. TaxID=1979402 RepID=UPI00356139BE
MKVNQKDNGLDGAFYVEVEGRNVAELSYSHEKPNKLILQHTVVSEDFKGKGIGYELIEASVNYMRSNNLKVIPKCSYADAIFKKKHAEYADVLN